MGLFYTYHPEEFYFTGCAEVEIQPENSTEVVAPSVDNGDKFAKWTGEAWVVKHLVDGEWVDCTDSHRLIGQAPNAPEEVIEQPIIEGETNGEQI